jgi:membrane protein implicated in regulation of membrane protease activity
MITKTMLGISALISLVYVVADEIALNYMLAAANGAAAAATARPAVDLAPSRRDAEGAVKDLLDRQQQVRKAEANGLTRCADQAWPYYSDGCLVSAEGRQVRIVRQDSNSAVAASNLVQAVRF